MVPPRSCAVLAFFVSVGLLAACRPAVATDHIVGGHLGWNPNINYSDWSNNQTFYVNDLISFRYPKHMYDVFEVNRTGYDNCTTEGAVGNWSSGKDFIPLDKPGRHYFICGNGLCFSGMKVSIVVLALPSPPASHSPLSSRSKSAGSDAARMPASLAGALAAVLAIVAAFIWI